MKVKVILNPYANRWGAKARIEQIKQLLHAHGLDFDLELIPHAGEGQRLAREAAAGNYDVVVAAGGDGTLNEVINGLIRAAGDGPTMPFAVFPIGTGNDFSDMTGLPRDLNKAVENINAGITHQVDAGIVNGHYFHNNCALAMEPLVTIENVKIKRLSGNLRYVVALIKALFKLKAWDMHIKWNGGEYNGSTLLLSICNGPRVGGLFPMAPQAKTDDGLFDFVHAPNVPKATVLVILAKLIRGRHLEHPSITYQQATWLEIESNPGTPIHADGEVLSVSEAHVSYQILPGKLTLLKARAGS